MITVLGRAIYLFGHFSENLGEKFIEYSEERKIPEEIIKKFISSFEEYSKSTKCKNFGGFSTRVDKNLIVFRNNPGSSEDEIREETHNIIVMEMNYRKFFEEGTFLSVPRVCKGRINGQIDRSEAKEHLENDFLNHQMENGEELKTLIKKILDH